MSLIKGKCPECGGVLDVDNNKEAMICLFCGTPYIVEKAINNYKIQNANNVNIYVNNNQESEDEKNLRIAYGRLKIDDYFGAFNAFAKVSATQPENADVWKNMLICITKNFTRYDISEMELEMARTYLSNYNKLTKQNSKYIPQFAEYKNAIIAYTNQKKQNEKAIIKSQKDELKAIEKEIQMCKSQWTAYSVLMGISIMISTFSAIIMWVLEGYLLLPTFATAGIFFILFLFAIFKRGQINTKYKQLIKNKKERKGEK